MTIYENIVFELNEDYEDRYKNKCSKDIAEDMRIKYDCEINEYTISHFVTAIVATRKYICKKLSVS